MSNYQIKNLKELTLNRKSFNSSSLELNNYFHHIVSQDEKRNFSRCYVLVEKENQEIIGYYTLSAHSIQLNLLPESIHKKIRYPQLPVAMLGRLAIDQRFERQGFGSILIADAIKRLTNEPELAVVAIVVEAKDDNVFDFYTKLGFIPFDEEQNNKPMLFYPLSNIFNSITKTLH